MGEQTTENPRITLRDIDNRDGDGAPYEFTGTAQDVCAYIDGPLRRDLTEPHDDELFDAMEAVGRGDLDAANSILRPMSIHLRYSPGVTP